MIIHLMWLFFTILIRSHHITWKNLLITCCDMTWSSHNMLIMYFQSLNVVSATNFSFIWFEILFYFGWKFGVHLAISIVTNKSNGSEFLQHPWISWENTGQPAECNLFGVTPYNKFFFSGSKEFQFYFSFICKFRIELNILQKHLCMQISLYDIQF